MARPEAIGPATGAAPELGQGRLFRRTLLRVLLVQGIALALLWWLQAHYGT